MNSNRQLRKLISSDVGGAHTVNRAMAELPEDLFAEEADASELYAESSPPAPQKKHSAAFINHRRKVRYLAEDRLTRLSNELFKLADEVRYHDPLMAELLDDAWDAAEEAIALMQDEG